MSTSLDEGSENENWGFSDVKISVFSDDEADLEDAGTCYFNVYNCDEVTVYENCDYSGRRAVVDGTLSCIDWTP